MRPLEPNEAWVFEVADALGEVWGWLAVGRPDRLRTTKIFALARLFPDGRATDNELERYRQDWPVCQFRKCRVRVELVAD